MRLSLWILATIFYYHVSWFFCDSSSQRGFTICSCCSRGAIQKLTDSSHKTPVVLPEVLFAAVTLKYSFLGSWHNDYNAFPTTGSTSGTLVWGYCSVSLAISLNFLHACESSSLQGTRTRTGVKSGVLACCSRLKLPHGPLWAGALPWCWSQFCARQ